KNASFSVWAAGLGPLRCSSLRRARYAASSRLVAAVVSMLLARRKNPSFLFCAIECETLHQFG
ncbi:MAG: hypothetical protein ABIQ03_01500, partial [Burkholderiales bacterium]